MEIIAKNSIIAQITDALHAAMREAPAARTGKNAKIIISVKTAYAMHAAPIMSFAAMEAPAEKDMYATMKMISAYFAAHPTSHAVLGMNAMQIIYA